MSDVPARALPAHTPQDELSTVQTAPADQDQKRAAAVLCIAAALVTLGLLPFASRPGPVLPSFILVNQTALVIVYALSAWVLFAQFRRGRSLPLLFAAAGTLFTAAIVLLQFLSIPNAVVPGRLLGTGPETTTWLWTFWHLGPPACALAYALALRRSGPRLVAPGHIGRAAALAAVGALALAALAALASTAGLPWLPHQVSGDDYFAVTTSGVGPAVQLLTVVSLLVLWRATAGQRTVLELWLVVGLALLVLDNLLTLTGGARATVGWYVGRVEALVSAFVILWAYLHEMDALRRRAEQAVLEAARAEAALRQAQKLEAVGRLTGGVAHDFNNLLMVMTSCLEVIQRRPDDTGRIVRTAQAGLEAVERGSRLTRQLLSFARKRDLRPENVNANALLLDFEPLMRRAVGEEAQIDLRLDPALRPALLDRSEFEAAVLNLVVNARDALVGAQGHITVSTRNLGPSGADGRIVVSVADDGRGMDAETLSKAAEPFFTTKEFGKGSGLGLAQVHGFALAAGGSVELRSELGAGTTVELILPCAEAALRQSHPGQKTDSATSALRAARPGEVILAVEDEPAVLAAVVENLTDLGYAVVAARDAAEALERLGELERVDVLFSDVVMPGGMNGVQLAVEARRVRPGLRVVLTSGYTNEALANRHAVPADVPVLAKPYRREELAQLLSAA